MITYGARVGCDRRGCHWYQNGSGWTKDVAEIPNLDAEVLGCAEELGWAIVDDKHYCRLHRPEGKSE